MLNPNRPPRGTPSIVTQGKHPASYDLAREVLCTIPIAAPCDIRVLATDFRMSFPDMAELLGKLRGRFGIGVSRSAMVTKKCRSEVERVCEAYWRETYEQNLN